MSDTPETDAAWACFKGYTEPLQDVQDLSRKLERERDEAIRQLENLKASAIHTCHDQCQRPMCVLRRERDESRELAQQMSESNQVLMADVRFYRNAWEQLKEGAK
jgi:hypothetical protein